MTTAAQRCLTVNQQASAEHDIFCHRVDIGSAGNFMKWRVAR